MSQGAKVFDPFAVKTPDEDVPSILGPEGREFKLVADITASKESAIRAAMERVDAVGVDASGTDAVDAIADVVAAATVDGDELGAWIREEWREDRLGMRQVRGLVEFVSAWLAKDVDPEG